jgi:hypothetical protein
MRLSVGIVKGYFRVFQVALPRIFFALPRQQQLELPTGIARGYPDLRNLFFRQILSSRKHHSQRATAQVRPRLPQHL